MVPAMGIGQPVIFVDYEQTKGILFGERGPGWHETLRGIPMAGNNLALDRFESGNDDRGLWIDAKVSRHDPHLPAPRAPFGEFIIRQCPRGHGEQRPAGKIRLFGPTLENVRLTGAGRSIDHGAEGGRRRERGPTPRNSTS